MQNLNGNKGFSTTDVQTFSGVKKMQPKCNPLFSFGAICLMAILANILLGPPGAALAADPNSAVAKINQTVLFESDLQRALSEIMPAGVFHGGFSSKKRASYRPQALEKMIENELFYQEALRIQMKVDQAALRIEQNKVIKRLGGAEKYQAALKRAGMTQSRHIQVLTKQLLTKAFVERQIEMKSNATLEEARTHFQNNRERFLRPEARRIRHILIAVKPSASQAERQDKEKLARQILAKIQRGENMAALAAKHSNDRYRIKGGDYGLVHAGRLIPELEKEVFRLELNELSGLVTTMYGFHIARVEEIKPPQQLTFEEVSGKIKKMLTRQNHDRIRQTLIAKLRNSATITLYRP
jgi:parvulin-like peptidyl-prolyl isomerase